ncbi:MAG: lamin tail domain-containing protein [Kiritimatiellae bacterium]|nr:lamin tail domain-containing protein [Kiritimatiellia bacterium]
MKRAKAGWLFSSAVVFLIVSTAWADVTVVFNEIMYHPTQANEAVFEWVELRNQLAVDMDISGWSITKGIEYLFPENTVVPGRGFLVVAASPGDLTAATGVTNVLGPFTGRLSNSGEKLELRNNNNRLMDLLDYGTDGLWPVAADGGGASLAKIDEDGATADPANWGAGPGSGGTPGACNHPAPITTVDPDAILLNTAWKYIADGSEPGAGWQAAEFDDSAWNIGNAIFASSTTGAWISETQAIATLFNSGVDAAGQLLAPGQPDPHYVLTASTYSTPPPPNISATVMANHPNWLANNALSSWIGAITSGSAGVPAGGYNFRTTFDLSNMDPATANIALRFAADNRVNQVLLNGVDQGLAYVGFNAFSTLFTLSSGFTAGINTLDFHTFNEGTSANPAGFRVEAGGTATGLLTPNTLLPASPATKYFRTAFIVEGDPVTAELALRTILDDGAVYYLNGVEVLRLNLPGGALTHASRAVSNVVKAALSGSYPLSTASLVAGTNVLAVAVHQAATGSGDIVFGADLTLTLTANLPPHLPPLAFNKLAGTTSAVFQVEIYNYGSQSVNLSNCVIKALGTPARSYLIPAGIIPAGGRVVFDCATLGFDVAAMDRLALYTASALIVDAATLRSYPRVRWPEGSGAWHHPTALNFGAVNNVALCNEIVINEIQYKPRAPQGAPVKSLEQWVELYNRGASTVELSGWRLEIKGKTAYRFPEGQSIASGAHLVVALDADYLQGLYPSADIVGNLSLRLSGSGARVELFDNAGAPLPPNVDPDEAGNPANVVTYADSAPWPQSADGLGATLELRDPRADNSRPEAWAASDDSGAATWQSYSYSGIATKETANSPDQWREFVIGLLEAGEILIDDITVVETPSGAAAQLLQNTDFESGGATWRMIGNHRHSEVIVDPDNPANRVLRLVSNGYTGHMHNHVETTLANNQPVVNGREYQISFRAKWVSGCNRLLTRLYFNRLPRLTEIARPALSGTPGTRNSCYTANLGPTFSDLAHQPVVPSAGQGVAITVSPSDPDGVASATLRYAVNSGSWQAIPMTLTAGPDNAQRLNAIVPGQSAGSVVQFFVEATDGLGAIACAPAAGADSRALFAVSSGAPLMPQLQTVRIVMTPADAAFLHSHINVMSNERLGCTLITDEKHVAYDAAVHLQGSQRGRDNPNRVGFSVRLPADCLYRGVLDRITVDRSGGQSNKGGKHDEILLKHAINKAGALPGMYDDLCQVFAPLAQHNGTGLLILTKYSKEFLDSQYKDGNDGELFKLELIYHPTTTLTGDVESYKLPQPDGVKGTDIKDLGVDPEAYRWVYLKENHTDRNHYAPMIALAKAFSLNGAALDAEMERLMDVDQWMRGVAFIALIGGSDIYTYGGSHNAIFYFRPEDGRAMLFPWDMDYSFVQPINTGFPGTGSANTSKLINRPNNLHAYYGHLYDLTAVTGDASYMGRWAAHYAGLLGENWSGIVTYLKDRADFVRGQLQSQIAAPFAITSNNGGDFSVNGSPVTLVGSGSILVKTITVNGIVYPVTWSSATTWSLAIPLPESVNTIALQACDLHGTTLAGASDTITITNLGELAPQPVVINEWMAVNNGPGGYPDPCDQKFQDWFELYNPNSVAIDLSGYTLTDNLELPAKWTIPAGTVIAPRGFLLVWADGEPEQNKSCATGDLHANFKLSASGEALGLYSPTGVRQHALIFGEQSPNVSQGFYPDGNLGAVYNMSNWSPRAPNRMGAPAAPQIIALDTRSNNLVTISALTEPDRVYVIEYSDRLRQPGWAPLGTNRATEGVSSFIDPAAGVTQRFYRAVLLP